MYVLDTNVFITAARNHYRFSFCPGFWDWLVEANQAGKLVSVAPVKDELMDWDDEVTHWVKQAGDGFFPALDSHSLSEVGTIIAHVQSAPRYNNEQYKQAFMGGADAPLVAFAKIHGYCVVTHEVPSPGSPKVKIPDVCRHFDVEWMSPFEMLDRECPQFVLAPAPPMLNQ